MSTPGSSGSASAAGLTIMLISVGIGVNFGATSFGVLLSFTGLLAGVSLVVIGVRTAGDGPAAAHVGPAVFARPRALAASLRRHRAVVGLVMASSAVTAVSGEAGPVLCFAMFTLLLLGLSLINVGVLGSVSE